MSYLKDSAFTAVKTDAKFEIRYVKGLSSLLSHVSGASSCQDIPPISLSIHFSFTFRFLFLAVTFHLPRGGNLSSGTLLPVLGYQMTTKWREISFCKFQNIDIFVV